MRASAPRTGVEPALVLLLICASRVLGDSLVSTLGSFLPGFLRSNVDELVKTASDGCEILPLEILYSRQYTAELPLIELIEYSRTKQKAHQLPSAHMRVRVRPPRPLLLYVPGWWNNPQDESTQTIVKALLQKHSTVLVLDTRFSFSRTYVLSASRVNPLAHLIFDFIKNLHETRGVPLSSIHLIGFSLGSHVVGITGKLVQRKLKSKIGTITALDPAKPCFTRSLDYRLDKKDADFVQVVHSSAGVLGLEQPIGHVDVYMNGVEGTQPECTDKGITIDCDHSRAWKSYAASVADEAALTGRRCESWDDLRLAQCSGNETVLGYNCDAATRGLFLYKSRVQRPRSAPKMKVFNLFDLRTW